MGVPCILLKDKRKKELYLNYQNSIQIEKANTNPTPIVTIMTSNIIQLKDLFP